MPATATAATLTQRFETEFANSRKLYEQARTIFPQGVTHDLRYLEPFPIYIDRAEGAHKWDVDGHELIDYWSGHGALLLGHSHPAVTKAVATAVSMNYRRRFCESCSRGSIDPTPAGSRSHRDMSAHSPTCRCSCRGGSQRNTLLICLSFERPTGRPCVPI